MALKWNFGEEGAFKAWRELCPKCKSPRFSMFIGLWD